MPANLTEAQRARIESLCAHVSTLRRRYDARRGVFTLLETYRSPAGAPPPDLVTSVSSAPERDPGARTRRQRHAAVLGFVEEWGELLGPPELWSSLALISEQRDPFGHARLRYQWIHRSPDLPEPIPIHGSFVAARFTKAGRLTVLESSCRRQMRVAGTAHLPSDEVAARLAHRLSAEPGVDARRAAARHPTDVPFPFLESPRLVLLPDAEPARLVWVGVALGIAPPVRRKPPLAFPRAELERLLGRAWRSAIWPGPLERAFARAAHLFDVDPFADRRPHPPAALEPGIAFVDAITSRLHRFLPLRAHASIGVGVPVLPMDGSGAPVEFPVTESDGHYTLDVQVDHIQLRVKNAGDSGDHCKATVDVDDDGRWEARADPHDPQANRSRSQQPNVDAMRFARDLVDWYTALDGTVDIDGAPVPVGWRTTGEPDPITLVVHAAPSIDSRYVQRDCNGNGQPGMVEPFIKLGDGRALSWVRYGRIALYAPNASTFLPGSASLLAHEYAHGVADHRLRSTPDQPSSLRGWLGALQEGLADAFGALFRADFRIGLDISLAEPPIPLRSLVFPRDPLTRENILAGRANLDHWPPASTDRPDPVTDPASMYDIGTILAHAAFLMDAGGVHFGRHPATTITPLIPVRGLGSTLVPATGTSRRQVSRTARIFFHALAYDLQLPGSAIDGEDVLLRFADACVRAAEKLDPEALPVLRLALHAVGLEPPSSQPAPIDREGDAGAYGRHVTALSFGRDFQWSEPHVSEVFPGWYTRWSSPDLFLWNEDGGRAPILDHENRVYCRVRNVGGRDADVRVMLEWGRLGTVVDAWSPIAAFDIDGLSAGAPSFPDDDTPPAAGALARWPAFAAWRPVANLASGQPVALRATLLPKQGDVSPQDKIIESRVAVVRVDSPGALELPFVAEPAGTRLGEPVVDATSLPSSWTVTVKGTSVPREHVLSITIPDDGLQRLESPVDGVVRGTLAMPNDAPRPLVATFRETHADATGPTASRFFPELLKKWATQLSSPRLLLRGRNIEGLLGGRLATGDGTLTIVRGRFLGLLDVETGELEGDLWGQLDGGAGARVTSIVAVHLRGSLSPRRVVEIAQSDGDGAPIGGFSVELVLPPPNP